ncbi:MAG: NAD-dependent epimerase/dehydratase family protein [Aureispira sp.]|nr:NAD-dependent epimerase/dehydratase family protein [Aureispira sp.]
MNIFITGASGFVGGAVSQALKDKHQIFAMARSERSAKKVKEVGATPIKCALNSVTVENLKDIDLIIHSAAFVEEWGTRQQFWQANVEGTRQLLDVAKKAGVKKFMHISTEATLFNGQDMIDIDENYPYPDSTPFLYSETKREAEKLVIKANQQDQFETVVIRPRLIWGPGDLTVLPATLKMVKSGSFRWIDHGKNKTATVHIDNLVHGILLAIDKARAGQIYFITDDEEWTIKDFLTGLLATQNVTAPNKNISKGMLRRVASVLDEIWRLFRIKKAPPITKFAANIMSADCTINLAKAKKELGYQPVISVQEGFDQLKKSSN